MKFHKDMTIEQFWVEWFGLIGREIGSNYICSIPFGIEPEYPARRKWSDNPEHLLQSIPYCEERKAPIWITAQPHSALDQPVGIEKLFFDFDDDSIYCPECDKYYKKDDKDHIYRPKRGKPQCEKHKVELIVKPRKEVLTREIIRFLNDVVASMRVIPIVVETYKGYHVYIFLRRIITFSRENEEFAKLVYEHLINRFISQNTYTFFDTAVRQDIHRMARVPLTIHEKWGERCRLVKLKDGKLVEDKVRSVSHYRQYGIRTSVIEKTIIAIRDMIRAREEAKIANADRASTDLRAVRSNGNFVRPCFTSRLRAGEMVHSQRLAFLRELYWNGYHGNTDDETVERMMTVFAKFSDFVDQKSRYYIRYFLNHDPDAYPPYRCSTIQEKGWCIEKECPKYRKLNK